MDGRDEDIWREFKLKSTPTKYGTQSTPKVEDFRLKVSNLTYHIRQDYPLSHPH